MEADSTESECSKPVHVLDQLAEALCAKRKTNKSADEDPFNDYMDAVQAKFHADNYHFKSRLSRGYQVLLEQLQSDGRPD